MNNLEINARVIYKETLMLISIFHNHFVKSEICRMYQISQLFLAQCSHIVYSLLFQNYV